METFAQLMTKVLEVFPNALVEEQGGEIVIYPGYRETPAGIFPTEQ